MPEYYCNWVCAAKSMKRLNAFVLARQWCPTQTQQQRGKGLPRITRQHAFHGLIGQGCLGQGFHQGAWAKVACQLLISTAFVLQHKIHWALTGGHGEQNTAVAA